MASPDVELMAHLMRRAGFGASYEELQRRAAMANREARGARLVYITALQVALEVAVVHVINQPLRPWAKLNGLVATFMAMLATAVIALRSALGPASKRRKTQGARRTGEQQRQGQCRGCHIRLRLSHGSTTLPASPGARDSLVKRRRPTPCV